MTQHPMPSPQPSTDLTLQLRQPPRIEAALPVLNLARRLQFAQRLAVLIRRMQTHRQVGAKEESPDES
jgi:hypothetical protein